VQGECKLGTPYQQYFYTHNLCTCIIAGHWAQRIAAQFGEPHYIELAYAVTQRQFASLRHQLLVSVDIVQGERKVQGSTISTIFLHTRFVQMYYCWSLGATHRSTIWRTPIYRTSMRCHATSICESDINYWCLRTLYKVSARWEHHINNISTHTIGAHVLLLDIGRNASQHNLENTNI
jgi:hypothetical protein